MKKETMSGDSVCSQLNGSSGFVSFDESMTTESTTLTMKTRSKTTTTDVYHESVDYVNQNRKNKKLSQATNGKEIKSHDGPVPEVSWLKRPDDGKEYVFRHGRWWNADSARIVDYYKSFGDWYNKFPKTDNCYSPASPWYGSEVAPGIPRLPNMCRRSYREARAGRLYDTTDADFLNWSHHVQHEELTWTSMCSQWIRTWVTTVIRTIRTFTKTTTRIVSAVGAKASSYLHVSSSNSTSNCEPNSLSRFLPWFLLLLLLLIPLLYFTTSGTGDLSSQLESLRVFTSAVYNSLLPFFKPYFTLWNGVTYLVKLVIDALLFMPSMLADVCASVFWFFSSAFDSKTLVRENRVVAKEPVKVQQPYSGLSPENENEIVNLVKRVLKEHLEEYELRGKESSEETRRKLTEVDAQNSQLMAALTQLRSEVNEIKTDMLTTTKSDVVMLNETNVDLVGLVQGLLDLYHADRTGKTDYALASNGASIASIRCTRPFDKRPRQYDYWGIIYWDQVNPPDVIIKPGHLPGECWAFEGANGYVVIQLSVPIYVSSFSMEHTPKELTPHGNIKSAPRKFSVWGLKTLETKEEELLGRFEFLDNGKSLQSFDAVVSNQPYQLVELRIESNHGHLEYTCLYRFRVHGVPAMATPYID